MKQMVSTCTSCVTNMSRSWIFFGSILLLSLSLRLWGIDSPYTGIAELVK